jgi:hypothetical protein
MSVAVRGKLSGNLMRLTKPTAVFHPGKEASPTPSVESGAGLMLLSKKEGNVVFDHQSIILHFVKWLVSFTTLPLHALKVSSYQRLIDSPSDELRTTR